MFIGHIFLLSQNALNNSCCLRFHLKALVFDLFPWGTFGVTFSFYISCSREVLLLKKIKAKMWMQMHSHFGTAEVDFAIGMVDYPWVSVEISYHHGLVGLGAWKPWFFDSEIHLRRQKMFIFSPLPRSDVLNIKNPQTNSSSESKKVNRFLFWK